MRTVHEPPRRLGPDPREGEPWFRNLPETAREQMRARWEQEEREAGRRTRLRRGQGIQCMLEGATLLFVVQLLFYSMSLHAALVTVIAGAATGLAWNLAPAHRTVAAGIGLAGFVTVRLILGMGSPIFMALALAVVLCGSSAMAIPRQAERMGA